MVGTKCPTGCSRMDHIAPPENKEISVRDFLHEETKPPLLLFLAHIVSQESNACQSGTPAIIPIFVDAS